MSRRFTPSCVVVFSFAALAAASRPAEPSKPAGARAADPVPSCARRAWAVTSLVLDNDVDPPTRQEMLLAGIKGLLAAAEVAPPAGLSRRVSALTTEQEFTAFLRDLWPKSATPPTELETALLGGLLQPVPGSPALLSAEDRERMDQLSHNRYVGTGIQLRMSAKEGLAQVVVAFPGGPARRAGVRPDDLILEVDHVSVRGASMSQVVDRLRGPEGRPVSMLLRQPGATETRLVQMTRALVPFETVIGFRHNPDETWQWRPDPAVPVAYVRITSVTPSCLHELRKIEARLRAEDDRALVLDLRFSGGDDVHSAALVADGLLDAGVLWRVRDARHHVKEYRADPDCLFRGWPLVVVVNPRLRVTPQTNALAPQLIAAALQDNGRAAVVGEPTAGDGYVATFVPLPDDQGAVWLRTGMVERAGRRAAPGWGVQPDHTVKLTTKQDRNLRVWLAEQARSRPSAAKAPEDPQLDKALELLRAALKKAKKPGN